MLRAASTFAKRDVIAYLLALGADPNDQSNGGSSALDGCLKHVRWEDSSHFFSNRVVPASNLPKSREIVRLLLERGAKWRPDARTIVDVRKSLYHIAADVITEFIERLRFHQACSEEVLHELLRTPKMQQLLRDYRQSRPSMTGPHPSRRRNARTAMAVPERPKLTASAAYYLSRYTRKELYEQVWASPTQQVATRYEVTDVAIAKACRHLNIPKPPRGYWAKKEAGLRVPDRPPLPSLPGRV